VALRLPQSTVDLTGGFKIGVWQPDFDFRIRSKDLSEIDRVFQNFLAAGGSKPEPLGLGGNGEVAGHLGGRWTLPEATAQITAEEARYANVRFGSVRGTVEMREGALIRNGAPVKEGYVEHTEPDMDPAPEDFRWQRDYVVRGVAPAVVYHPSRNNWGPLVVPKGNYFVLGDNRDNSLDSRYWGFVPDSLVKGRPFVIYYSYSPDSSSDRSFAWLTHIRWTRLGERIR